MNRQQMHTRMIAHVQRGAAPACPRCATNENVNPIISAGAAPWEWQCVAGLGGCGRRWEQEVSRSAAPRIGSSCGAVHPTYRDVSCWLQPHGADRLHQSSPTDDAGHCEEWS